MMLFGVDSYYKQIKGREDTFSYSFSLSRKIQALSPNSDPKLEISEIHRTSITAEWEMDKFLL